ncbi:MAG TPA: enoyl-ACP reductase [Thermoclostridium caenicola]|uniref:enoyl-ACP reductase FabI n=1 Tax=Thermoclostridium caenicola TaxID=659425 RepID=UPI002CF0E6B4|nr:enoyl-ACP reductase [Thermoclostridium caenicola]HPO77139.1 enoyl-ACP reductase [Thermoclostridium caenicola]
MGDLLAGRNILIMGVRNKWSIAWGIAQAAYKEGANIIYTYLGEREKAELEKLTEGMGTLHAFPCDVTSDEDIEKLFDWVKSEFGVLHGLVHAIAFAGSEDLQDSFLNTGREGFKIALDISAYSLVAVCRHAAPLMTEGGSIITLTYRGSVKVTPGYNVMGVAKAALEASVRYAAYELGGKNIRVNSLSAGPIKTLSAKGVKNFSDILKVVEERTPLKRNVTLEDLGKTAVYLLSDLSSGVTGEVIYVDSGYNNMGL